MPVTTSAKKALRTATRRHEENIVQREGYKRALKDARKAGADATKDMVATAQSLLDRAAKKHTIHPNKAARLKSRLAKRLALAAATPAPEAKPAKVKATTTKKATAAKAPAKKAAPAKDSAK